MLLLILLILLLTVFFLIYLFMPFELMVINMKTIKAIFKLPGPFNEPIIGEGVKMGKLTETSILDFWREKLENFGTIVGFWVLGVPVLYLNEADDLEIILSSPRNITKGREYLTLTQWLQEGLLISSGEKWHHRRKLLTPAFHFKILGDSIQSLNKNARNLLANMLKQNGKPFEIDHLVTLCTLDVISETAMGYSLNLQEDKKEQEYLRAVKSVCKLSVNRIVQWWSNRDFIFRMLSTGRQYYKDLFYLHNFTEKIIRERKNTFKEENLKTKLEKDSDEDEIKSKKKRKALLDILIEMDRNEGNLFSDKDIREEVDTFMFEGHDTTHSAIVFSLYLLGRHLQVQEKVYDELYNIFGDNDREATISDLNEMHYLEMVIKESLRLYPSVPYMSRQITEEVKIKDYVIPAGVNIGIITYYVHRNPKYFPDPEVFDPERFTHEKCKARHPYAYIPFSAGPRNCIGQKFAMLELKTVLSTIIRFAKIFSTKELDHSKLTPLVVLKYKEPIELIIKPRISATTNVYY